MSSFIRQSLPALMREADRVLESRRRAVTAPVVLWTGLDESPDEFADRVKALRRSRSGRILAAFPHGFPVPAGAEPVEFAPKMFELLHPSRPSRYRCASGGRGSGKSHAFATAIVLRMIDQRVRVLACREIMHSLRESVHHLIVDKIDALRLMPFFNVSERAITCTTTGAEVIFAGLFANIFSLKSLEGVGLCWIEEAESVSARSLEILTPTIREPKSEIWLSMNPNERDAPAMEFTTGVRDDTRHVHVTFVDCPWFPASLDGERLYLQRVDDDAYRHVWLGEPRTVSDALIFKGKFSIAEFEPASSWDGPYHGLDFGFANDPTAGVKCWVNDRRLYVERECYGLGVDIDKTPALLDVLGEDAPKHVMRADSARPESISFLQRHGWPNVVACEKWPGSVDAGIGFLRSFESIILHPRCKHVTEEFRAYSFKVDRLTGDIRPEPTDAFNHTIDAIRYALGPLIRQPAGSNLFSYYKGQYEALKARGLIPNKTRSS